MGHADSVVVEAVDDDAESVEFFVHGEGGEQGHQAKRQWKNNRTWPVGELRRQGILADAATHVGMGREFHFVSTLPARELDELTDVARRSDDFQAFTAHLAATSVALRNASGLLATEWGGPESAYETLKKVYVRSPDERQLHSDNLAYAEWLIDGPPEASTAVLGQIVLDTLAAPLTHDRLWDELKDRGLSSNPLHDDTTLAALSAAQTERWLHGIKRELLEPVIARAETNTALEHLHHSEAPLMIVGDAGFGKSAVVAAVVDDVQSHGWPVLALRMDRHTDVRSARQLGEQLDLPTTPILTLATVAQGREALFVCDQLDAVSLVSGRATGVFDVFEELMRLTERFPNIHVLLACRKFDIDNDRRLSTLTDEKNPQRVRTIEVSPLDDDAVRDAVAKMGLDPARLDSTRLDLLRAPLNLVLLREVVHEDDPLDFKTVRELMDIYWRTKRRGTTERRLPQETRFEAVITQLVSAMSAAQELSVPESVLFADGLDDDATVLVSEHVIVHERGRYAFFHEALFDHAFARAWMAENRSVLAFLLAGEQELFRRGQVRQVLSYLRDGEPERFVHEAHSVLASDEVRFHVKDVVLALLRALPDPNPSELRLVLDFLETDYVWRERLELLLRTTPWFDRLYEDGVFAQWLASGETVHETRAVTILGTAGGERGDAVAELLKPYEDHADFPGWLVWATQFIDLEKSRPLFDLLLGALRSGRLDGREDGVWLSVHSVGDKEPAWAVELLEAWLVQRPNALVVTDGRVVDLGLADHGLLEIVREAAEGAAFDFATVLLPYMQRVMELAEVGDGVPRGDWHFGSRIVGQHISELDDALLYGMEAALRKIATDEPPRLPRVIEPLVNDSHQGAQNLVYEALRAAGASHADWAAELLLRGGPALESGYSDDYRWTTRQLIEVTASHMSDERYERLEAMLIEYVPDYERSNPRSRGHGSFTLLSAVPEERLSPRGLHELNVLRRKFERDAPEPPRGIVGGMVGSPIRSDAAQHMTDEQWLKAMQRYEGSERRDPWSFRGGSFELASQVLQPMTREDPERFARVALRLDQSFNPEYLDAILMGLGDSEVDFDPDIAYQVIRHAASLGTNRRWLGYALKHLYQAEIPDDIVELLLMEATRVRALETPDMGDPYMGGINSEVGGSIHTLALLLFSDETGRRARLVEPHVESLTGIADTGIRTTVAELLRALMPWHRDRVIAGFRMLAESGDIALFLTQQFEALAAATLLTDASVVLPTIETLLAEGEDDGREHGARLATFAATDGGEEQLLARVVSSTDVATRRGAASVLADRVRWVQTNAISEALTAFFHDGDEGVRDAAARFVVHLRDLDLAPYESSLGAFIESPALEGEVMQVEFTLGQAEGDVNHLTVLLARRFLEMSDRDVGDIRTRAAGDAREIGALVLRSYSGARETYARQELLDIIDRLLELNAYGFNEAVQSAER